MENSNGGGLGEDEVGTMPDDIDGVSLEETVTSFQNSSETQLPGGSETEYDDGSTNYEEEDIEDFMRSQFPGPEAVAAGSEGSRAQLTVRNWLEGEIGNQDGAAAGTSVQQTLEDEDSAEQMEKIAAVLSDALINNVRFRPQDWEDSEANGDAQEVPVGSWKSNIIQEIQQRLPLALMNMINNVYCSFYSPMKYRYTEILYYASKNMKAEFGSDDSATERAPGRDITFNDITRFNRTEYFSGLRSPFKKVLKSRQPIVRAAQKFVNLKIDAAFENKHAVIFAGYSLIPKVVGDCDAKYDLKLSAEQKAKYALRLQKAIYYEMVDRCLNLLGCIGYELRLEQLQAEKGDDDEETFVPNDREHLSFSSSQGSEAESMKSTVSDASSMSINSQNSLNPDSPPLDPIVEEDLRNSPGFMEYLRANVNRTSAEGSIGSGSFNSYNSYGLLSPVPAFSLPERDRSPILVAPLDNGFNVVDETHLEFGANLLSPAALAGNNTSMESDASSHNEGPQRRRRRLN